MPVDKQGGPKTCVCCFFKHRIHEWELTSPTGTIIMTTPLKKKRNASNWKSTQSHDVIFLHSHKNTRRCSLERKVAFRHKYRVYGSYTYIVVVNLSIEQNPFFLGKQSKTGNCQWLSWTTTGTFVSKPGVHPFGTAPCILNAMTGQDSGIQGFTPAQAQEVCSPCCANGVPHSSTVYFMDKLISTWMQG